MLSFALLFTVKVATSTSYLPVQMETGSSTIEMIDTSLRSLSDFYGVSYEQMKDVIQCESGWKIDALNPNDPEGGSRGLLQFQPSTFYGFASALGIESPDINNPFQQIEVATYLWSLGQQRRWSCYRILGYSNPHHLAYY